ncbi:hypothetical protein JHD48_00240 [Sulfurimonas sp. SAG-AH-194-I05]|nr:hypothetical protein [Sulfurimonas sp. SAG-AH-194-I05]MDF1874154.1 hypothetical protein [Sulfurimonas sp. SAG-AH-194-I05]
MIKFFKYFLLLLVIVAAALPVVGSYLIKDKLDIQVNKLRANGIQVKESIEEESYFSSARHYEFLLKDMDDFAHYINARSNKKMSKEIVRFLEGTLLGVDLKYSNLPFIGDVSIDIYPLFLSKRVSEDLLKKDKDFYKYVNNFLKEKGILYHLDYNILNEEFKGYVKDINESYTMKNGSILEVQLLNATYKGKGSLRAPKVLETNFKTMKFVAKNSDEEILMQMKELTSYSTMESKNTYTSQAKVESMSFVVKDTFIKKTKLEVKNMDMNVSSMLDGNKAKFSSHMFMQEVLLDSKITQLKAEDLNYDISFYKLDKIAKKELEILLSESDTSKPFQTFLKVKDSFFNLMSKGVSIDLRDFSVAKIKLDGVNLEGFSISSKLDIKKDKNFIKKMKFSPIFLLRSMNFNLKMSVSKKIFKKILILEPMLFVTKFYIKKRGNNIILNVVLNKGRFRINGKSIFGI